MVDMVEEEEEAPIVIGNYIEAVIYNSFIHVCVCVQIQSSGL